MSPNQKKRPNILVRHITLVGLMGVGKSRLGRHLAARLGCFCFDSDREVARQTGLSIPELFEQGEDVFRKHEAETVFRLLDQAPAVLALGGGAWQTDAVRAACIERSRCVWLDAPSSLLAHRVGRGEHRPLLLQGDESPLEVLTRLRQQRTPLYQQAQHRIDVSGAGIHKLIETLVNLADTKTPDTGTAQAQVIDSAPQGDRNNTT